MARIYIVRHGQASLMDEDYDRLSPLGERQSRLVGSWLGPRSRKPVVAISGRLRRQAHTLAACIESAGWEGLEVPQDPGFDEYSDLDLFGQAFPDLVDRAAMTARLRKSANPRREFHQMFEVALARWLAGDARSDGGLTWEAFRQRCMASLEKVSASCGSGECAVVATSGGVIAAICQSLLGVPAAQVPLLHTPLFNASITTLLTRPGAVSLSTFNAVSHLEFEPAGETLLSYR